MVRAPDSNAAPTQVTGALSGLLSVVNNLLNTLGLGGILQGLLKGLGLGKISF